MLTELKVSQFAIIDHIHIHFNEGLNILSGETGAGKSILIKSLALLMGAKSSSQDIRSNKESATIEGAFDLSDRNDIAEKLSQMGIDAEDGTLIVRRLLQKNGKSKVYLNGNLSGVNDLRRIVFPLVTLSNPTDAPLIEITGQHENKDLMSARYQMDVLDQYCGNLELRQEVELAYQEIKNVENTITELESQSGQREQQVDFLQFQINEIENLDLQENEDEELKNKILSLKQKGQWQQWLQQSLEAIHLSDRSMISQLQVIQQQAPESTELASVKEQIQQAYLLLEDIAYNLEQLRNSDIAEDLSLDDLESRLSRIRKLQKKFGSDTNEILRSLQGMREEHHRLTHLNETLESLREDLEKKNRAVMKLAKKLSKKRQNGALLLSDEVNQELKDLNMKGLQFLVTVSETDGLSPTGIDRVQFMTKTGKGDEARSLAKAASGGELSRILLSLKQVIGASQHPRTFLFDEVDTGVSGPTAEKVGAKLKNLAGHQQVICVTHLPQVACFGDHHYFIEKTPTKDTVEMSVSQLKKTERVNEIARLISGEKLTKTSIAHAKQLLEVPSTFSTT